MPKGTETKSVFPLSFLEKSLRVTREGNSSARDGRTERAPLCRAGPGTKGDNAWKAGAVAMGALGLHVSPPRRPARGSFLPGSSLSLPSTWTTVGARQMSAE